MHHDNLQQVQQQAKAPWIAHVIVSLVILAVAFFVVSIMFANKPEARKFGDRPPPSVAVEITSLNPTNYDIWIDSYGSAEALTETQLVSDVSGRVIEVSPNIRAGASFKKDDVLVKLDDRDYRIEVDVAKSSVADAEVKYLQELAQADIAERDWNVRPGSEKGQALALRKPQVAAAKASLDAAKARLAKAELNLARTEVIAPFDGRVLRQMVDLGQVINPNQAIAEIYSTDAVEVRLPVKAADLNYLKLPDEQSELLTPPQVIFEGEVGRQTYQWTGHLVRSEGAFDPATRMLYVVAVIDEPFRKLEQRPAIRVGQFLRAKIEGERLSNVFVIPRRAVSQDYFVSVAEEGVLQKQLITPLWTDQKSVVVPAMPSLDTNEVGNPIAEIRGGLRIGQQLILTPTANLPNGTRIKPMNNPDSRRAATTHQQTTKDTGRPAETTTASKSQ